MEKYVLLYVKGRNIPLIARRHEYEGNWNWDIRWGSGFTYNADDPRLSFWVEIPYSDGYI